MSLVSTNNFIFIHIYKCGGMSLRKAIMEKIPVKEVAQSHSTAKETKEYFIKNNSQLIWEKSFKFSFVRNPYDWAVSLYEFIRKSPAHENYEEIKDHNFEQFCVWYLNKLNNHSSNINGRFNTLSQFLYDDDNNLLVDFVGKLENFKEDYKYIADKLGLKNKMPKINVSDREKNYRTYYNDKTIEMITRAFHQDLVNFNYKF
jgi:hypothetical protein